MARSASETTMVDDSSRLLASLGRRLKDLRIQRRLTQQQLGERCRLTGKYVSEVERGLRNVSFGTLHRIAHSGLGTTLSMLMFRVDEPEPDRLGTVSPPLGKSPARRRAGCAGGPPWHAGEDPSPYSEELEVSLAGYPGDIRAGLMDILQQITLLLHAVTRETSPRQRVRATRDGTAEEE